MILWTFEEAQCLVEQDIPELINNGSGYPHIGRIGIPGYGHGTGDAHFGWGLYCGDGRSSGNGDGQGNGFGTGW